MSGPEIEVEVRIGEHGSETCVGIRPPLSGNKIKDFLADTPARERPDKIAPEKSKDNGTPYTLLRFTHPHFGKFRNDFALNGVETIATILKSSGVSVNVDKNLRDLSGDNTLFD